MSETSTTASPATAASTSISSISYFAHHLVLLAIVVGLVIGAVYEVESLIAKHDSDIESKYSALLTNQTQQNQAEEAKFEQIAQTLLAQNASLTKRISAQQTQTQTQQKIDTTLDAQQAAARISQQTNAKTGEVVAQDNSVVLDLPISRDITSDLDELQGIQDELADTQTQLKNETTIAINEQTTITGLKKQNSDEVQACAKEVTAVKAKARKSKIKAFFEGVGAVLAGIAIHAIK